MRRALISTLVGVACVAASVGSTPAPAAAAARWSWPVAPPHPIVRGFEAPATVYSAGHRGIDVSATAGTAVLAPDDGTVEFSGTVVDRGVVSIDHADGVRSSFEPVTPRVAAGAAVHRGEVIAVVATGGSHPAGVLHIGARQDGAYVSPLLFLGGAQRAVLLPLAAFPGAGVRTAGGPAGSSR